MVESGRLLSDCRTQNPYPGFESRSLRHSQPRVLLISGLFANSLGRTMFALKTRLLGVLILILVAALAQCASAEVDVDRYFALRRQYQADKLPITQVKMDPETYRGRVAEVRGTLSGIAQGRAGISVIIESDGECYIVATDQASNISSGSKVCALVQIGDRCTSSLTDLHLLSLVHQSEVVNRERRAMEAEAAKNAKKAAVAEAAKRQAAQEARRYARGANPPSRSGSELAPQELIAAYTKVIKSFNSRLSNAEADAIARSILGFGIKYQIDPRLVVAVILAESHFRPEATSPKGAMGLGQLMPGTAAGLGVSDPYNVVENVGGSVRLIRGHLDKLSGKSPWTELTWHDLSLALASYNAGPGAVRKYGGVPPYRETRNYIKRVISIYKKLCGVQ